MVSRTTTYPDAVVRLHRTGQLGPQHERLPGAFFSALITPAQLSQYDFAVLRHDRAVRFPRREARRLWKSHRRHAHVAQDRECPDRAEQQTKAGCENYRYVCLRIRYDKSVLFILMHRVRRNVRYQGITVLAYFECALCCRYPGVMASE